MTLLLLVAFAASFVVAAVCMVVADEIERREIRRHLRANLNA